tara:strand:- start:162 stop:1127 length:966 start_codon:yes stop_codon:yes gene_type:complete
MKKNKFFTVLLLILSTQITLSEDSEMGISINQIQFVGSHNSYKQAMPNSFVKQLMKVNPKLLESLDYEHIPLGDQLDLGIRKLELDIFYRAEDKRFLVGHVQQIDMSSNCESLRICLSQIISWSDDNPSHSPIWISFNAKDNYILGLPTPEVFTPEAFLLMDSIFEEMFGDKLIRPRDIVDLQWPFLSEARGKFILILDEGGIKRDIYFEGWKQRPMFINAPEGHPAAAIMIINDPIGQFDEIQRLVKAGYMIRTRADADTREARDNDTRRKVAAFESGAQAVSTDYYIPATHFGNEYQVSLPEPVQCNPITAPKNCRVSE